MTTQRTDGDGWVECACGQRHWGLHGAAGLMLVSADGAVLLQHRAEKSHQGDTWALPGGARKPAEPAHEAALREAAEEAGVSAAEVNLRHASVDEHHSWSYTTVIGHVPHRIDVRPTSWETKDLRWVEMAEVYALPLHPAFAHAWPILREQADRQLTLVIDAANTVGSRPDGWWRDRLGANERLRDRLAFLAADGVPAAAFDAPGQRWWPDLHLVVEGKAAQVQPVAGVTIHSTPHDGDSLLADVVAEATQNRPDDHVVAVTADRDLRARVHATGARTVGPATLTALL